MKVLITGATGMIGSMVLEYCLKSSDITEVIVFTRNSIQKNDPKLTEVTPNSFLDYKGLESYFSKVQVAYFCLGAYTGAVPDDKFKEITVDYTKAFADILYQQSPEATFSFLSGAGADPQEKSRMSFARYKGMAENYLISKQFGKLFLFRPGYIYPVQKREEPNLMYKISRSLYPLIKLFGQNASIKSTALAEAIFLSGTKSPPKTILENKDILSFLDFYE